MLLNFRGSDGLPATSACTQCTAGKYCDTVGLKVVDLDTRSCAAGYFCVAGSQTGQPSGEWSWGG